MFWIIGTAIFIVGVFAGLCLFAILETTVITKILMLKAEVIYQIKEEFKLLKKDFSTKPKRKK